MPRLHLLRLSALLLMVACASGHFEVASGAVSGVDFTAIERFGFLEGAGAGPALHEEPLERHQVRRALRARLEARGFRFEQPADCLLRFEVGSLRHVLVDDVSRVVSGLRLELLDPDTKRVLWWGWAGETAHEAVDRDQQARRAVRLLLDRFPPPTHGE